MWFLFIIATLVASIGAGSYVWQDSARSSYEKIIHNEPDVNAQQTAQTLRSLRRLYQMDPSIFPSPLGNSQARISDTIIRQAHSGGGRPPADVVYTINGAGQISAEMSRQDDLNVSAFKSTLGRIGTNPDSTMNVNTHAVPGAVQNPFVNVEKFRIKAKGEKFKYTTAPTLEPDTTQVALNTFTINNGGDVFDGPRGGNTGDTGGVVIDPGYGSDDDYGYDDDVGSGDDGTNGDTTPGGGTYVIGGPDVDGMGGSSPIVIPGDGEGFVIVSAYTNPNDVRYSHERKFDAACRPFASTTEGDISSAAAVFTKQRNAYYKSLADAEYNSSIAAFRQYLKDKKEDEDTGSYPSSYGGFKNMTQARAYFEKVRQSRIAQYKNTVASESSALQTSTLNIIEWCDGIYYDRLATRQEVPLDAIEDGAFSSFVTSMNRTNNLGLYSDSWLHSNGNAYIKIFATAAKNQRTLYNLAKTYPEYDDTH